MHKLLFYVASSMSRGQWDVVSMASAVQAVLVNKKSKKQAARMFSVPRGTLQRHINKSTTNKSSLMIFWILNHNNVGL